MLVFPLIGNADAVVKMKTERPVVKSLGGIREKLFFFLFTVCMTMAMNSYVVSVFVS